MNLADITPMILTYNEEPNVGRALERLRWASQILIVDSFSDDATLDLIAQHPRARVVQRKFDTFADQCNFGLGQIYTPWVLALDADYLLTEPFEGELAALQAPDEIDAYYAEFRYVIFGRPLRGTLYPPRAVLFRKDRCHFFNDGHTQLLGWSGPSDTLKSKILHDDRKSLSRWLSSQDKYAMKEADKLAECETRSLKIQDRLRLMIVPAPIIIFIYCLIFRGLFLDGLAGWYYVLQRVLAEIMLSLRLIERRLRPKE